ncbi:MAG TPA: RNA-binding S4 domain-containing protein [Stellaceae bacterium]|nr:RNA-binding S4 domain-containing protein [Stellaceae bacterium]
MNGEAESPSSLRLDKWLWFARVARTRSLAARLCAGGCVTVGGREGAKPHHALRIGDVVVVDLPHQRRQLAVRALGARRGPPAEARLLYEELAPPLRRNLPAPDWVSLFAEDATLAES